MRLGNLLRNIYPKARLRLLFISCSDTFMGVCPSLTLPLKGVPDLIVTPLGGLGHK